MTDNNYQALYERWVMLFEAPRDTPEEREAEEIAFRELYEWRFAEMREEDRARGIK